MTKRFKLHTKINMKHKLKLMRFTNINLLSIEELLNQYNMSTNRTILDSWKFLNRRTSWKRN